MLKKIVKMLIRFVKIVTFGASQLLEQPKYILSIVFYSLAHDGKIVQCLHRMITITYYSWM